MAQAIHSDSLHGTLLLTLFYCVLLYVPVNLPSATFTFCSSFSFCFAAIFISFQIHSYMHQAHKRIYMVSCVLNSAQVDSRYNALNMHLLKFLWYETPFKCISNYFTFTKMRFTLVNNVDKSIFTNQSSVFKDQKVSNNYFSIKINI